MSKSAAIKIKENPLDKFQQDNKSKPYHGHRRNRGMPSCMEPVNSYTDNARDHYDQIFGHTTDLLCNNQKESMKCTKQCIYNAPKHQSNCIIYTSATDIIKCLKSGGLKINKKSEIIKPNITPKLTGAGIYDGDKV